MSTGLLCGFTPITFCRKLSRLQVARGVALKKLLKGKHDFRRASVLKKKAESKKNKEIRRTTSQLSSVVEASPKSSSSTKQVSTSGGATTSLPVTNENNRVDSPRRHSLEGSSPKCTANFILMVELRKNIFAFREMIDLPSLDGSLSVTEIIIQTMKDLQKLSPEIVSINQSFEMEGAEMDKMLIFFYEDLRAIGDSWIMDSDWIYRSKYKDSGVGKNKSDRLVEHVLAALDGLIKTTKERFGMMELEMDGRKSCTSQRISVEGRRSFRRCASFSESSSSFYHSPLTPTSAMPKMMMMSSSSSTSPSLWNLRSQALDKLSPVDLKRFTMHILSNRDPDGFSDLDFKNCIDEADEEELEDDELKDSSVSKTEETEDEIQTENHCRGSETDHGSRTFHYSEHSETEFETEAEHHSEHSETEHYREHSETERETEAEHHSVHSETEYETEAEHHSKHSETELETEAEHHIQHSETEYETEAEHHSEHSETEHQTEGYRTEHETEAEHHSQRSETEHHIEFFETEDHSETTTSERSNTTESSEEEVLVTKVAPPSPPPPPPPPSPPPTFSLVNNKASPVSKPPPPPPSSPEHEVKASAPPPPPPSKECGQVPQPPSTNGSSMTVPPAPPGSGKSLPVPPAPPGSGKSLRAKKATSKLKRSAQLANLYWALKGKLEGRAAEGKAKQSKGKKEVPEKSPVKGGKSGMADALAEMTKRSSYFQQIEEDVQKYSKSIEELKTSIKNFQTKDMKELLEFHSKVESVLEKLTDESQVLARFEGFPEKKLEAIRTAGALYKKLDGILTELKNWKIEPPVNELLDKIERYFNKVKTEIETVDRTKDEESRMFQRYNINIDFEVLVQVKETVVDVSSNCMELALKEKREAKEEAQNNEDSKMINITEERAKRLWRAFQFAFKVYTFAGGHDERADHLTKQLADEIQTDPEQTDASIMS